MNSKVAASMARLCTLVKSITVDGASRRATDHLGDPFLPESVQMLCMSCFNLSLMPEYLAHWKKK